MSRFGSTPKFNRFYGSPLAYAYLVWWTSVNAFVGYISCSQNERMTDTVTVKQHRSHDLGRGGGSEDLVLEKKCQLIVCLSVCLVCLSVKVMCLV